jgi:hypothetical protein
MQTDGQKNTKGINYAFLKLLSRSHPNSHKLMYLAADWWNREQSDCYVECVTVQHIECTESVECATELYWQ